MKLQWSHRRISLSDLIPWEHNPREISKKKFNLLDDSIERFGLCQPIVVDYDYTIIGGHQRYRALGIRNEVDCFCYVPNRKLTEKEFKDLNILLNSVHGQFDDDILSSIFEIEELFNLGFDESRLLDDKVDKPKKNRDCYCIKCETYEEEDFFKLSRHIDSYHNQVQSVKINVKVPK